MLRIVFNSDDLRRIRVSPALGPFAETVLAFKLARRSQRTQLFSPWLRSLRGTVGDRVHPLGAFYSGYHMPDLMTVVGPVGSIDEGTDILRSCRRDRLRAEICWLSNAGDASAGALRLLSTDEQPRRQLADSISSFHSAAVQPHWKAMHNLLAQETAMAGRALGAGGIDSLLATLRPSMLRWRPPELHVITGRRAVESLDLGGRGLVITPSVFVGSHPILLWNLTDEVAPPRLLYPALRELATARQLWLNSARGPQALGALLGRTRSEVLEVIADGCGTVELARRAGISPAAASQHAATLRAAGLASRKRDGSAVMHTITPLGRAILNAHPGMGG